MLLLLLLQVLQAWLELQSCHLNSCFTYFKLSGNWLLPTFPFPLLFLFLPLIWGNYYIFEGWRFLVFILFSTDFSVKAVIAPLSLSLCPFATSNFFVKVSLRSVLIWLALACGPVQILVSSVTKFWSSLQKACLRFAENECLFSVS